ncbi:MAG: hypothetical protein A3I77_06505 [Gammaproteobacteria bacterium RIFCSPLOWO2_02_FULL_42_14]|nr:MAG: hypothetical protein A3B71_06335 [Gammaproteobacteria bacterium RIFCSPHIGHO2_02_FULL_42_43]OGT29081.1 MAG: hypothetical protein A2624_05185 [Gammaproteobacteria bacterium RIFCSPHIGHO2_01_FULL_42_8]OGT52742.1 MAG: hypothetical protein A3E54_02515 [Gammaproteobacteria bacterium RIFCSPHIGHO2_12_FULL_41_25]OGT63296.1 MAG: hypothetical protein A3I77_06505 [Gammaproteobacteria bacterium RIFCSPLOWO2_02_FULL_42_14]OGT86884.1 MAG: hypothetical protein A3G86_05765 [Gammaproteobacteria bacterium R
MRVNQKEYEAQKKMAEYINRRELLTATLIQISVANIRVLMFIKEILSNICSVISVARQANTPTLLSSPWAIFINSLPGSMSDLLSKQETLKNFITDLNTLKHSAFDFSESLIRLQIADLDKVQQNLKQDLGMIDTVHYNIVRNIDMLFEMCSFFHKGFEQHSDLYELNIRQMMNPLFIVMRHLHVPYMDKIQTQLASDDQQCRYFLSDVQHHITELQHLIHSLENHITYLLLEKDKDAPCVVDKPEIPPCMIECDHYSNGNISELCNTFFGKQSLVHTEKAAPQVKTPWTSNFFRDFCYRITGADSAGREVAKSSKTLYDNCLV